MSKIRVIDLLNKIANGEEVPKNIRFEGADLRLENDTYYKTNTLFSLIDYIKLKRSSLNEDVEIIEEEPEIDIQKIEELEDFDIQGLEVSGYSMTQAEYLLEDGIKENRDLINKLAKAVKKLDNQINNK